jgi:hypothetical protein
VSSEDARRTALIEKERPIAKEIGGPAAIGEGMTPEPRQRRLPVSQVEIDAAAVRLADGSLRAVLECPTLPVPLAHGERSWLAAMGALLDRLDGPFQLVVQRRGRDFAARAVDDPTSRLRDSYERLLAERWPDRAVRHRRLLVVVSASLSDDEDAQAASLERQVHAARESLREAGVETARVPADALAALASADDLEELRSEVRVAGRLARPLRVVGCPTLMAADWLAAIRATDADLDVSLRVRPPVLASAGRREVRADLILTVWAADRARLDEAARAVERALAERLVLTRRCVFEAEPAFASALPLGRPRAGAWPVVPLRTLTSLLSSVWGGDADRDRGLLCGVEPGSGRPLLLDRHVLTSRSSLVLGGADADRQSVLKVEAARVRVAGAAVTAIDTRGDFAPFVDALGGDVLRVDREVGLPFDPFAVAPGRAGALGARIACLAAAIELLAGGLTDHQAGALEHALSFAFAARGHSDDGDAEVPAPPRLRDVVAALESQSSRAFGAVKAQIDALARVLRPDGDHWPLAGRTQPPASCPLVVYDVSGVPDEERPAAALLALDHACAPPSAAGRGHVVVVDDIAALVRLPESAGHLVRLAKQASVDGIGLRLATDDVAGLVASAARRLVADGSLTLLLRQDPDAIPALAELLHLTPAEQSWLAAARAGEGVLVTPDQRLAYELAMTEEERRLITGGAMR